MSKQTKILGIAESLRKNSYNTALLRTAADLMPENIIFEAFDPEGMPPFNQDPEEQPPKKSKNSKQESVVLTH